MSDYHCTTKQYSELCGGGRHPPTQTAHSELWELAPTPRVGPARKTSCRTCLWSLIALDGLPERASEAKIAFAQLFSLLNFGAGVVLE